MKKYILVIGAGNLGRRHIQSLKLSTHDLEVYVVDTSKEALSQVKEAVEQVQMTTNVRYFTQLEDVPNKIDVAIVATTANSRLLILRELIGKGARNIILEKIAFNSLQDIAEATKLVSSAVETKVWVNCPRRLYPIYQLFPSFIN